MKWFNILVAAIAGIVLVAAVGYMNPSIFSLNHEDN